MLRTNDRCTRAQVWVVVSDLQQEIRHETWLWTSKNLVSLFESLWTWLKVLLSATFDFMISIVARNSGLRLLRVCIECVWLLYLEAGKTPWLLVLERWGETLCRTFGVVWPDACHATELYCLLWGCVIWHMLRTDRGCVIWHMSCHWLIILLRSCVIWHVSRHYCPILFTLGLCHLIRVKALLSYTVYFGVVSSDTCCTLTSTFYFRGCVIWHMSRHCLLWNCVIWHMLHTDF